MSKNKATRKRIFDELLVATKEELERRNEKYHKLKNRCKKLKTAHDELLEAIKTAEQRQHIKLKYDVCTECDIAGTTLYCFCEKCGEVFCIDHFEMCEHCGDLFCEICLTKHKKK